MRKLRGFFLYLKYFFEPKDKLVRAMAYSAAQSYYAKRPLRNPQNPRPRVIEYSRRREEFLAFQRAYNNSYRHSYAMKKLKEITIR